MDERLKSALDFSNFKNSLTLQRKVLKEKLEAKLTYGCNGGIFKIDQTLITFVQMMIDHGRSENVPLIDNNGNPILIEDLSSFRDNILDRYFSTTLDYYNQYQEIKKSRSVGKLVSYE